MGKGKGKGTREAESGISAVLACSRCTPTCVPAPAVPPRPPTPFPPTHPLPVLPAGVAPVAAECEQLLGEARELSAASPEPLQALASLRQQQVRGVLPLPGPVGPARSVGGPVRHPMSPRLPPLPPPLLLLLLLAAMPM